MTLAPEDRTVITELIHLHRHLTDAGELDRMHEVFTADVVYDVSDLGHGPIEGLAALKAAALAMGDANPVGHHVTNVMLTELGADRVRARSKTIGIYADGTAGSVTYDDTVVRGDLGCRIGRREVFARRAPLGAG